MSKSKKQKKEKKMKNTSPLPDDDTASRFTPDDGGGQEPQEVAQARPAQFSTCGSLAYAESSSAIQPASPVPTIGRTRKSKHPWSGLEVSQTNADGVLEGPWFAVPDTTTKKFSSQAVSAGKRLGMKFAVRQIPGNGVGVWRVA